MANCSFLVCIIPNSQNFVNVDQKLTYREKSRKLETSAKTDKKKQAIILVLCLFISYTAACIKTEFDIDIIIFTVLLSLPRPRTNL